MTQLEWCSFYKVWKFFLNFYYFLKLDETQVDAIDTEYYHMRKIRLGDICHDKDESLVSLFFF